MEVNAPDTENENETNSQPVELKVNLKTKTNLL